MWVTMAQEVGSMQYPTIYEGLVLACKQGKLPGIDLSDITYYVGRETIIPREDVPGMLPRFLAYTYFWISLITG